MESPYFFLPPKLHIFVLFFIRLLIPSEYFITHFESVHLCAESVFEHNLLDYLLLHHYFQIANKEVLDTLARIRESGITLVDLQSRIKSDN